MAARSMHSTSTTTTTTATATATMTMTTTMTRKMSPLRILGPLLQLPLLFLLLLLLTALPDETLAQQEETPTTDECTLDCPVDAPCVVGDADFSHSNVIHLDKHAGGMHCACPPGWTGVLCDHRYESCSSSEDCFHGGVCLETTTTDGDVFGNAQLVCDCTAAVAAADGTRYVGKYCETPFEKSCSATDPMLFCVNGGDCDPQYKSNGGNSGGLPCVCEDGWGGFHCEFKEGHVPDCTLDCHAPLQGVCVIGVTSPAEAQAMHRIWTDAEVESHQRCVCQDGYGGPLCDVPAEDCGDDHPHQEQCYYGGSCVTTTTTIHGQATTDHHCDCSTAVVDDHLSGTPTPYAGRYCSHPATAQCGDVTDDDAYFCTHGGTCRDDPTQGCHCPPGYGGHKCEFAVPTDGGGADGDGDDKTSTTSGQQQQQQPCGDVLCLNGSTCADTRDFTLEDGTQGQDQQVCDCTAATAIGNDLWFAGHACQYQSTSICSRPRAGDGGGGDSTSGRTTPKFCVHGGTCQADTSCACPQGWTGEHCEFLNKGAGSTSSSTEDAAACGDTVCYHGGECVETRIIREGIESAAEYYCACSKAVDEDDHLYAGVSCEYPSTQLCTTTTSDNNESGTGTGTGSTLEGLLFCTNHGTCDPTNVFKGCDCPNGFSGFSCEYLDVDPFAVGQEDNAILDQWKNAQSCGPDLVCKNGGQCATTVVIENGSDTSTHIPHCECATTATDELIFAGRECEHPVTSLCTRPREGEGLESAIFCVQGGTCGVNPFQGCDCPDGFTGLACEFSIAPNDLLEDDEGEGETSCGGKICYHDGTCVVINQVDDQTGQLIDAFSCDCASTASSSSSEGMMIYGGPTCSSPSTSVCQEDSSSSANGNNLQNAMVCFNHGVCRDDPLDGCDCPPGFAGSTCAFVTEDEEDQAVVVGGGSDDGNAEACGDSVCYNGGACVTTKIISPTEDVEDEIQYYCDCISAAVDATTDGILHAGERCEYQATAICTSHHQGSMSSMDGRLFCVNGGLCKNNPQEGCDCPSGWNGFFCEFEDTNSQSENGGAPRETCGEFVCLNGGTCSTTQVTTGNNNGSSPSSLQHCDCAAAYDDEFLFAGPNCEYPSSSLCTDPRTEGSLQGADFCTNGGTCSTDRVLEGCDCSIHWTGRRCELPADDEEDAAKDDGRVQSIRCGAHACQSGGVCIDLWVNGQREPTCDCTLAFDRDHQYDGAYCQYKSTEICSQMDVNSLGDAMFCVNNGRCLEDDTCHCPSGYSGIRCEWTIYEGQDSEDQALDAADDDYLDATTCRLSCANGGQCVNGAKDYSDSHSALEDTLNHVAHLNQTYHESYFEHCVCPEGFVGLTCEHTVEVCGDHEHYCLHGSTCMESNQKGVHICDCSQADAVVAHGDRSTVFAGASCEHPATDICSTVSAPDPVRPLYFCTNRGTCKAYVEDGEADPGCDCPSSWIGPHCEIRVLSSVASGGGGIDAVDIIWIASLSIVFGILVLLMVTCCLRRRRGNVDDSETCMIFRRRRRRGHHDGFLGEDPRSQAPNLAPKRFSSAGDSPPNDPSSSFASHSDPMIATGMSLPPDEEPGVIEPYYDEPPLPFVDERRPYYQEEAGGNAGGGYRDDPDSDGDDEPGCYQDDPEDGIVVQMGPPRDEDGNPLHNVEFL